MVMKAEKRHINILTKDGLKKNVDTAQDKKRRLVDEIIDKMAERHRLRESLNRDFEKTMKNAERRCSEEERQKGLKACEERIIAELQAKGEW